LAKLLTEEDKHGLCEITAGRQSAWRIGPDGPGCVPRLSKEADQAGPKSSEYLFRAFEENPLRFGRQIKIGRKASRRPGSRKAISKKSLSSFGRTPIRPISTPSPITRNLFFEMQLWVLPA
jgi:hypothetical protein